MQQYYLGNTLINDSYLGRIRVEDLFSLPAGYFVDYLVVAGGGAAGNGVNCGGGGGAGGLLSGS